MRRSEGRWSPSSDGEPESEEPARIPSALLCLDELFSQLKISQACYSLARDRLMRLQETETQLLQKAEQLQAELDIRRQVLKNTESPRGPETEVSCMRQQLLNIQNDLREMEDRERHHCYEIECLQEKKRLLKQELKTQAKPLEQEDKCNHLKERNKELGKEIFLMCQEHKNLNRDIECKNKEVQEELRELDVLKEVIETKKAELFQLLCVPGQMDKEIEQLNQKIMIMEKEEKALCAQVSDLAVLRKQTEARGSSLQSELTKVVHKVKDLRERVVATESVHIVLQEEQTMAKEKKDAMMQQRSVLDINNAYITGELKRLQESQARNVREHNEELRLLGEKKQRLKLAADDLVHTQHQYDKTKSQWDSLPKTDSALRKRKELEKEVEHLKWNLVKQESVTEAEAKMVEQCMKQEQKLLRSIQQHFEELHHLHRLTQIKADERDQKRRELLRAQNRYDNIKPEMKAKDMVLQDHRNRNQNVMSRLNALSEMYVVSLGDTSKCKSLVEKDSQERSLIKENLERMANEMEHFRATAISKHKNLQMLRLKTFHNYKILNTLQKETTRLSLRLEEMEQKHRHKDLDLTKLKQDISSLKQELLRTRGACEAAQQSHSTLVFQVQKGDEEIRTLNDTLNAMERRIQSNNIEVESLDDTISFLKRDISEKKRQIVVCQKQLTCKKSLEEEINLLQTQLLECKDQNLALEKSLENPDFESRIRKLQGSDPSPEELISKIQQLEVKLGEKEQQLHEKELVYEQEDRLCNALQAKVDRSRQDTLEQAMKANKMKASIKKCTKKVKAVAAELAMVKANAMALQQERQEEELRLDVCRQRLEQGLPPSEDMEQEWLRYLRDEHRRHADQQLRAKMSEDEERQELPSGTITTAEPRPNAYIPLDDPLPLPKPYGALAPYKPSQPGTSMRHIRKPKPRPIEI